MHGKGMFLDVKKKALFEGWFREDQLKHGRLIKIDTYYVGQFEKYQPSGYGHAYFSNGDKYEGQWKEEKFHGEGAYTYYCGAQWRGKFKNNDSSEMGEFNGNITHTNHTIQAKFPGK